MTQVNTMQKNDINERNKENKLTKIKAVMVKQNGNYIDGEMAVLKFAIFAMLFKSLESEFHLSAILL